MNPDLLDMLRQANEAVRKGADPEAVGRRISEATSGRISSLAALGDAVQQQGAAPVDDTAAAQQRLAARGGSAVGDFARMAAQGATFGLADEIVGVVAGPEAKAASRQRVADLRTLAPGASMASEVAGGVAVPFFAGTSIARGVAGPGASMLARAGGAAAGGAVAGGLGGGLTGAGEAEGGPIARLPSAAKGAAGGAVAGGLLGGFLSLAGSGLGAGGRFLGEVFSPEGQAQREARRRVRMAFGEAGIAREDVPGRMAALGPEGVIADLDPRLAREARAARNQAPALERSGGPVGRLAERTQARGERLARALRETSGITESMPAGQAAAERAIQDVRRQHYRPLERQFPEVWGSNVQAALQDPRISAVAKRVAPGLDNNNPPSFTELQDIMMDLRDDVTEARARGRPNASKRASDAFDALTSAMEQDIPGFAEAQRAFYLASQKLEGYQAGFDAWTGSAREIQEALTSLPPDAQDSFRVGLIQRWEEKLLAKEGTTGAVNSILRAGEDMRAQIRAAFGSTEAFTDFLAQRDLENTFRLTEAAVQGNSTTAQQALDALSSAPTTKSELLNRIYDAVLSPGESRRIQAELVGESLLGRDVEGITRALRPNRFGVGEPGAAGGLGSVGGIATADRLTAGAPTVNLALEYDPTAAPTTVPRMDVDTLRTRVGQSLQRRRP